MYNPNAGSSKYVMDEIKKCTLGQQIPIALKQLTEFCTSKRLTLKPLEASANLLTIYSVFDTMANFVGKPDFTDAVRVHTSETKAKSISFHKMPTSNLHSWENLDEFFKALQQWQEFFDTQILLIAPKVHHFHQWHQIKPLTKAHGYQIDYRTFIGLYSEQACEAYRHMWSALSVTNRTITHHT